ncbi:MAG TPA: response regulator [Candidatus Angelobacter sp.]|nr:response regulator [Candidatus Angelobacter sp.]
MSIVLIADDKAINREFLGTLLTYKGHRLVEASNGAEALERVRSERPDLVIADVLMPVMDGYEFVRRLRSEPEIAETPVIFYTASYHEHEARALARACGVQDVIIKPAEPEYVLARVTLALGKPAAAEAPAVSLEFDRSHLRLLTDKLSSNVNALEAANQRLADLLELGRVLASEHDSQKLLEKFCPATRELIGARYAFLGVFSGDRVLYPLIVSGTDAATIAGVQIDASKGVLANLAQASGPLRIADTGADVVSGLPLPYAEQRSFLGIPLRTASGLYGLVWLLEKLGASEFSAEDERVLVSLAAQAGVAYENAQRYRQIQQYASELEHRVEERTAELKEANGELQAFTYSVAHDLRAPLRQIHSFAEILREEHEEQIPPPVRECLKYIREGTLKMVALVDDLLQLSQVGRKDLNKQATSLDQLLTEAREEIAPETKGRDIEWKIDSLPTVQCDPVLMRRVFANLLSNAVKYTRPRAHAVIEVIAQQIGSITVISVRDNGVGFDMQYAGRLFGVFQRLHGSEEFEGTGAGLAIVHRVLQRHGWRIWAEAEPGQGAMFCFTVTPSSATA